MEILIPAGLFVLFFLAAGRSQVIEDREKKRKANEQPWMRKYLSDQGVTLKYSSNVRPYGCTDRVGRPVIHGKASIGKLKFSNGDEIRFKQYENTSGFRSYRLHQYNSSGNSSPATNFTQPSGCSNDNWEWLIRSLVKRSRLIS